VRTLHEESTTRRYSVLEWAEGRTLRAILDADGRLSAEDTIHIALQICEALQYIHEQGFVHLDLKPENLIVDSERAVRLLDFGSARELRPSWLAFLPKKFGGTPDYAAPEQIAGKSVDARSDIYSMGFVLYEMLAGELPFSGVDSALALQLRRATDPPPLQEIVPEIPSDLSEIIDRATSWEPSKRQATAREFSSQLKQCEQNAKYELVGSV
jgi:serine/threonine protein kinase